MLLAVKDNTRARPNKTGERAMCPVCQGEVISKCGEINVWHWAHRASVGCDSWMESDSQWHAEWKALVPEDWIEIVIEKDGKRRLADIRLPNGCIVKLQHGPLSPEQIREYERFFGNMVWIFDVRETTDPSDSSETPRLDFRKKEMSPLARSLMGVKETPAHYRTFRWKHPRKHVGFATKLRLLDIGNERVFRLDKLYPDRPDGGFGFMFKIRDIVAWFHTQV
jgi:hypothetical protein